MRFPCNFIPCKEPKICPISVDRVTRTCGLIKINFLEKRTFCHWPPLQPRYSLGWNLILRLQLFQRHHFGLQIGKEYNLHFSSNRMYQDYQKLRGTCITKAQWIPKPLLFLTNNCVCQQQMTSPYVIITLAFLEEQTAKKLSCEFTSANSSELVVAILDAANYCSPNFLHVVFVSNLKAFLRNFKFLWRSFQWKDVLPRYHQKYGLKIVRFNCQLTCTYSISYRTHLIVQSSIESNDSKR